MNEYRDCIQLSAILTELYRCDEISVQMAMIEIDQSIEETGITGLLEFANSVAATLVALRDDNPSDKHLSSQLNAIGLIGQSAAMAAGNKLLIKMLWAAGIQAAQELALDELEIFFQAGTDIDD